MRAAAPPRACAAGARLRSASSQPAPQLHRARGAHAALAPPPRGAQELCCIVDEATNAVVGAQPRDVTVRERLWGRGAYVLVFSADGEALYVTRRSTQKDVYPGRLDVVTSGVVAAGESYGATAARELREELSLGAAALHGPEPLLVFRWADASCRVWGAVFAARARDAAAIRHADGEVTAGEWLPLAEVSRRAAHTPDDFTPVGLYVLAAYTQQQRALQRAAAPRAAPRRRCNRTDRAC